jgi:hypothetical protein
MGGLATCAMLQIFCTARFAASVYMPFFRRCPSFSASLLCCPFSSNNFLRNVNFYRSRKFFPDFKVLYLKFRKEHNGEFLHNFSCVCYIAIIVNTIKAICQRDSVTRFSISGFFHESVSPHPQSISLGPFLIFSKIRGDIRSLRCTTGVVDTGGKSRKSSIRKI